MLAEYEILTTIASFSKMDGEYSVADFESEYNMFKLLYCESNTYEKCGNDMIRLMASIKINDLFVKHSNSSYDKNLF